jgi:hypothetical protein
MSPSTWNFSLLQELKFTTATTAATVQHNLEKHDFFIYCLLILAAKVIEKGRISKYICIFVAQTNYQKR